MSGAALLVGVVVAAATLAGLAPWCGVPGRPRGWGAPGAVDPARGREPAHGRGGGRGERWIASRAAGRDPRGSVGHAAGQDRGGHEGRAVGPSRRGDDGWTDVAGSPLTAARPRRGPARRPRGSARAASVPAVDAAVLLDLCAAALGAGAALPRTLRVVGRHLGGADGTALVRAGATLELGGAWAAAWADAPPGAAAVGDALGTAWEAGASPGPQLRAAADRVRRERRARVRTAAGSLAVRLTLPLGLCFLPAFALLGLVPVILGLASGLGW